MNVWQEILTPSTLAFSCELVHEKLQCKNQWHLLYVDTVYNVICYCFYHASICEGGLESRNSVRPSVRPPVTRVDCDKTK